MGQTEHTEVMKEWETLRQETFQSQQQRFTTFQISMVLFGGLYTAYLSGAANLQREPMVFQSFLLLMLLPFVVLIRSLRLRDFYQACYVSDFIRPSYRPSDTTFAIGLWAANFVAPPRQ